VNDFVTNPAYMTQPGNVYYPSWIGMTQADGRHVHEGPTLPIGGPELFAIGCGVAMLVLMFRKRR